MSDNQRKDIVPKKSGGFLSKISSLAKRGLDVAQNPTDVQHSSSLSQFLDSVGGIPDSNTDLRFQEINHVLQDYFSKMTMDEISKELQIEFQKRPNGRTLKLLGFGYFHLGRLDDAIRAFTRTLEITEENPVAIYENLGQCYILKGDLNQASLWFGKSYRYDFDFFLDILGLEFLCITTVGRYRSRPPIFGKFYDEFSARAFQMEIIADALRIQYGNKKGHKSLFAGQLETTVVKASKEYATNHQKTKDDTETVRNVSLQLLQELKDSKWITAAPDELHHGFICMNILIAQRYYKLGIFLTNKNRLKEAEDAYQRAIKVNPDYAEAHYNLGVIFTSQNHLKDAENAYRKAIAANPKLTLAYSNLGLLLATQNRPKEAENCYRKAIKVDPNNLLGYFNLGILLVNQNRLEEAEDLSQSDSN